MIEIHPFSPQYASLVIDVILPIQREEFGLAVTLEQQQDLLDISGFYQKGAGNFWVALADGKVVGTIALLDIGNSQGALRKMFVRAAYRGSYYGVARQLLATLLVWSETKAVREIFLGTTAKFLAAHRFYEKSGFTEVAQESLPPAFPVMSVDTKFYARRFRSR